VPGLDEILVISEGQKEHYKQKKKKKKKIAMT
jgi:hypothetical protein